MTILGSRVQKNYKIKKTQPVDLFMNPILFYPVFFNFFS